IIVRHGISIKRNGGSQLSLECKDKSFRMTLGKKSSYFTKIKDSDIANTLIGNYSIHIGTIEDSKKELPTMVQFDTSDWDFMLSRMDINGKLVLANDGAID